MTIANFTHEFAVTYSRALPRIIYRSTLSCLLNPKGSQRFIHQVLDACDIEENDPVLGSVEIADLFPGTDEVILNGSFHIRAGGATQSLLELGVLAHVARSLRPNNIFEIGTFIGRTTRILAANSPETARVLTIDLPQEQVQHLIGKDYIGTQEASKIVQLVGDSTLFDYSPWHGKCDFVWVDGCHEYPFVLADTAHALRLCRPGGWIGWHDYRQTAWWSGVTKHVREIAVQLKNVRHVRGTIMVLGQLPE